jgi:WD40 repeat protein
LDTPPRIFISYARSDGEAFASALRQRLQAEHPSLTLWQDRAQLEGGVGWWKQITDALDRVKILIMVMTPAVTQSTVAQKEWRHARQQGVRVCPVLGTGPHAFDFTQLPSWMRKAHCYDIEKEWETFVGFLQSPGTENRVPFMAPDLRLDFVARPAEYQALAGMLLDRSRMNPLAITTALQGAGGFGKTTLAAALCHDDDIVTAFDDGILWVTLGERPAVQQELMKLYAALTGDRPTFVDAEDASIELASRLEDKNCLIVIDDVWDANDAKLFLRGGQQCARLITTRRLQVVTGVGASRVLVDEMTGDESVAMLTARLPASPSNPAPFRKLAERLGEWPLLLRLAASQLRERTERGDTVEGALAFVNRALDKRGAVAFDRANASSRNDAVATTVAASLALLSEADRVRAAELAVFSEAKAVPLSAACALWGLDPFDTEDLVQRLDDASLLEFDLKTGSLRMHDVLRSHLHAQLGNAAAVHARLVHTGWPDPYGLPDPFASRWYGWHLVQAGEGDRLRQLLLDFPWLAAKLKATNFHAVLQDFEIAGQSEPLVTIRDALRLSGYNVSRDPGQLGTQLTGRLESGQSPEIDRLLESIVRHETGPRLSLLHPTLTHPGGALVAILKGHAGSIEALDVSPDGARAVTGSMDWTLRLWDLQTWQVLRVFEGHSGTVHAVAFTPDGRRIVSASEDRSLRLWDADTGECAAVLRGHYEAVRGVAVAPDGRAAASLSEDGSVRLWDFQRRRSVQVFKGAFHQLRGIVYTSDGSRVLFGAGDGTVRGLDVATRTEIGVVEGQRAIVSALAVAPDGRHLLAGADDGSLRLWDLVSGEVLRKFDGHAKSVGCVAFGADGTWAVSGGGDRMLRVWDVGSGMETEKLDGQTGSVKSVAVLPGGQRILSASADRTVCCWRLHGPQERTRSQVQAGAVSMIAVSADGVRVVAGSTGQTVEVWDAGASGILRSLEGHRQIIQAVRMTGDGRLALTASRDGTLRVWDVESGGTLHVLKGHWDGVAAVAMTPTGDRAVSLSLDRTIRVWDLERGTQLRVLLGPGSERSTEYLRGRAPGLDEAFALQIDSTDLTLARGARLGISPDGTRAIFAEGGTIGIWHLDTGRVVSTTIEDFQAEELGMDPDAAIVGSILGTLCVIDPEEGTLVRFLDEGRGTARVRQIMDIVVDSPGRRAITASRDGSVRVWDLATGQETASLEGDVGRVDTVAIAPNGQFAYSVVDDTVVASDLTALKPLRRLSLDHNITAIAVTPDGLHAALGDESGRVHFLTLDAAEPFPRHGSSIGHES